MRLEQALRTVCPEDDIAMPYWDQTSAENLTGGIPAILTKDTVQIDGAMVPNPLKSFTLPRAIEAANADMFYAKPQG